MVREEKRNYEVFGTLKQEKREAKRIGKQLWYDLVMPEFDKRIDMCTDVLQVREVLATCRHRHMM